MIERENEYHAYEAILQTNINIQQTTCFTLRQQKTPSILAMNIFGLVQLQLNYKTLNQYDFILSRTKLEVLVGRRIPKQEIETALNELNTYPIFIEEIEMGATLIASWQRIDTSGDYLIEFSKKMMTLYLLEKDKNKKLSYDINDKQSDSNTQEKNCEIEKYVSYQINYRFDMRKKYSARLYEILSCYSYNQYHRVNLSSLKKKLGIIDLSTLKDKYPAWNDFNRYVLSPSVEEINNSTPMKLKHTPYKGVGRTIKGVMFTFEKVKEKNTQLSLFTSKEEEYQLHHKLLVKQYGLRKDQADRFLKKYSLEKEKKELYGYLCRHKDPTLTGTKAIANLGAYIAKTYDI